ncbi:GrpB family protein [Halococcus agarilyticus]|uniref:GrpB family protein n=1 Tax=Halococcus agarilyticus TaxID=1232219 RepID=UPI000677B983|nr:GrpB family protein [Halococcus agarilyticus]
MVNPNDDPIKLTPSRYETWRRLFQDERERVIDAISTTDLGEHVERIEHVGSTAVPELPAKDIVDVDIVVADNAVATVSETLETKLGGTRLENTDSWYPLFRTHDGQRFNDHVFAASGRKWKISVVTRAVLCSRPELRREYEQLKRELAHDHDDLTAYSRGKTAFVERVLCVGRDADDLEFDFTVPIDQSAEQA